MIDRHGLETAWYSLLRTRIERSGNAFTYMLDVPEFQTANTFPTDPLAHLSIGEVSALYEYSLAYKDRARRKQEGQYFTPDDIARFLARQARAFPARTVWVDPCSGVGNLSYWLVKEQKNPEKFLTQRLYLVDRDPLALLIARVLFTITFQSRNARLFHQLRERFLERDFLKSHDLPACDAALLNPPYVSGMRDESFRTSQTKNMYAYFLERVIKHCASGYVSITPQTFTNAASFSSLRKLMIDGHPVLDVFCFDNVPDNIFSGIKFGSENTNRANSTRAAVMVARNARARRHRITPLLRWRSHERRHMLEVAHEFLAETTFTEAIFPKIDRALTPLYDTVRSLEKLGNIVAQKPTLYPLQVPTTPRYFISANKAPVKRTSFKTLYFMSGQDRDRAYLVLNSSYAYWWWRVNDGGMTISERTLMNLPLPSVDLAVAKKLVRELEKSERSSKVIKMNAGKAVENIKHSLDLVRSLTTLLFPEYAMDLSATHANSNLQILAPQQLGLALES